MHALIIYDISDERKRNTIAILFSNYGIRIQKSAFLFHLPSVKWDELIMKLSRMEIESTESVAIFRLCSECATRAESSGDELDFLKKNTFII